MRNVLSFNEGWTLYFPKHERESQKVNLPHTWNAIDGMDGNGSYLRTTGIYSRTFNSRNARKALPTGLNKWDR